MLQFIRPKFLKVWPVLKMGHNGPVCVANVHQELKDLNPF
jgi:hypothetical protein